jgi:hypothetical protein
MDNDEDLDIYSGSLAHYWGMCVFGHDPSYIWRNEGSASGFTFTDVRPSSGMRPVPDGCLSSENDWEEAGPGWADWDNDTIPDMYATQFYPFRAHWGTLYRGTGVSGGVAQFEDVSDPGNGDCGTGENPINETVGPTCLKRWYSWNAAWADWDGDGDLDLALSGHDRFNQCDVDPMPTECGSADPGNRDTWPQPRSLTLFRNETGNQNSWLHLRLVGQAGNRAAIGARVTATAGAVTMMREVEGGHGYHSSQNDLPVEFGLGSASQVDTLTIRWQSAGFPTTTLTNLAANQRLVAYETGASVQRGTSPGSLAAYASSTLFPWSDPEPVLTNAVSYYYRLDDTTADIRVEKDTAANSVKIQVRN